MNSNSSTTNRVLLSTLLASLVRIGLNCLIRSEEDAHDISRQGSQSIGPIDSQEESNTVPSISFDYGRTLRDIEKLSPYTDY